MVVYELIPKLIRAALNNDKKAVESISLMIGRKIKKEYPQIASEIMQITANSSVGADTLRTLDLTPAPVDRETRRQLVKDNGRRTDIIARGLASTKGFFARTQIVGKIFGGGYCST